MNTEKLYSHRERGARGGAAPHERRTGWTAGKHRNALVVNARRLRAALDRIAAADQRCAVARELGVSDKTVRRWIAGEDRPGAEYQRRLVQF